MSVNILDTNILLRLILEDHSTLLKEAEAYVYKPGVQICIVTSVVIAEVIYVMRKAGFDRRQIIEVLDDITCQEPFKLDEPWLRDAMNIYMEQNLDYVDCYLIARSVATGVTMATLDKKAYKCYVRLVDG